MIEPHLRLLGKPLTAEDKEYVRKERILMAIVLTHVLALHKELHTKFKITEEETIQALRAFIDPMNEETPALEKIK